MVDFGMNVREDGAVVGDVDFASAAVARQSRRCRAGPGQ
jgi:5,10-methylene-tetrahydrofolate dehydrogenase/methenyl tetrahydrofolate cyclohydrolase